MVDFETEKICLNQIICQKKISFSAEDNNIIPDVKPDILSTISTSGNIYIYKKEIVNGKLKIDGGVYTYIMYIADNEQNNINCLHTVIDFSQNIEIENVDQNMNFECLLNIKNIECKILNGRKINIKVNIDSNINVISNNEKTFIKSIKDGENIQMISNSTSAYCLKGSGSTVAIAKDTITLNDNLADICDNEISVKNKELKISYNKVLSKADVVVEITYLNDKGKINTNIATIPIMGFIDIQNITENEICNTNYEIRNINIKPDSVENSSISIEIEFAINCNAFEKREINMIQDMYSPNEDISMEQENVNLIQEKNIIKDICNFQEKLDISDFNSNKIYNIKIRPNIVKTDILNNSISYEGELELFILYESSVTNRIEVKSQNLSFTHSINNENINKNTNITTNIEIDSKDFVCMPDNTINVKINLNFILDTYQKNNVNIAKNITVTELSNNNSCSLVIYYVKQGDNLWKIAKKFRSTMDDIASVNNIEDVDNLSVGTQLYIPKYVG